MCGRWFRELPHWWTQTWTVEGRFPQLQNTRQLSMPDSWKHKLRKPWVVFAKSVSITVGNLQTIWCMCTPPLQNTTNKVIDATFHDAELPLTAYRWRHKLSPLPLLHCPALCSRGYLVKSEGEKGTAPQGGARINRGEDGVRVGSVPQGGWGRTWDSSSRQGKDDRE